MKGGKTLFILLVIAVGVICAFAFASDASVAAWIAAHQNQSLRGAMQAVSRWGDWPSHVGVGLVAALIAYLRGSRRWMRVFLAMVLACAIAGGVARIVKVSTGRARPTVQADVGWNGPRLQSKYHAFPSGHVAASGAFFAVLAFVSWRAGALFLLVPAVIAFSRIYIGAHFLSDVTCAAVLGIVIAWLVTRSRLLTAE
ncbi:MAG: phosphatase PAP2 family protein [Verrucomicrobiota bacterium]|nr:phosphatase PAP2 family protein [Verrucomicrobiota bacterium]